MKIYAALSRATEENEAKAVLHVIGKCATDLQIVSEVSFCIQSMHTQSG